MGEYIYKTALAIALLGCVWNVVALILHLLGFSFGAIDSSFYQG